VHPLEELIVRRILEGRDTLSRNQHFHLYDDPRARRALRTARHLKSMRRWLQGSDDTQVVCRPTADGGLVLSTQSAAPVYRREARLSADELRILREDPHTAALIDRCLRMCPTETPHTAH